MAKVLVVGGGPAGCAATHFLTNAGYEVTLVERLKVLGGASRTYHYGGHPYHIGPRHFLTREERVWNFLDQYCPMERYPGHEFLTYVERDHANPETHGFYHFPIHEDEVKGMPDYEAVIKGELASAQGPEGASNLEEFWVQCVGQRLADKFILSYSQKMWPDATNRQITDFGFTAKGVALKTGPVKAAWSEAMSGFPLAPNAFDDYWEIATLGANVRFKTKVTKYDFERRRAYIDGDWHQFDLFVMTISPEDVFDRCHEPRYGQLRWMGRDFHKIILPAEHLPRRSIFRENVYFHYYAGAARHEPFTRIVEYKQFFKRDLDSPTTLLGIEIPSFNNKLYPYPMAEDQALARRYHDMAPDCVHWVGRLAQYRYLDFGMIIRRCFDLMEELA